MVECNSIESIEPNSIDTSNLNNQHFRMNRISKIQDYFIIEIKVRELMSKKLSRCISFFDYFDESLIVLSVTSGSVSIASFATVIGAPIGLASASLVLHFHCLQDFLKATRNEKKKHNKIVVLARSKLNSIESVVKQSNLRR